MIVFIADWRFQAIRGVAALVFGIVTLIWPGVTVLALVLLFGAYVLVDGISLLIDAFRRSEAPQRQRWALALEGALGVVAGIVMFVWPDMTALALLWVIAAWAMVTGVLEVIAAIRFRRELQHEWLLALSGVASFVFGVLLAITPGPGALVITWLIGWYAIVAGVVLLMLAWRLRRLEQHVRPAVA